MRVHRRALFFNIAKEFARRGTCTRLSVGAVACMDGRIVSSGYVGAPAGQPHCSEVGCEVVDGHCVRTIHAEANVVAFAARAGLSLKGTELYTTHRPCLSCSKLIVNSGIVEVFYDLDYGDESGVELLWNLDVRVHGPYS